MRTETLLVTPRNDEESLQIIKIAEAFGIPLLVSAQPHGARLDKEPELIDAIVQAHQMRVAIVENPSLQAEERLRSVGKDVIIIDHHRYEGLNRMKEQSSLEQFLKVFDISDEALNEKGFDVDMVRAVGALDRGFVWELRREGYTGERYDKALSYYEALGGEVMGEQFAREREAGEGAFAKRRDIDGILVIEQESETPNIREAISFIIAKHYHKEPPQAIVRQGRGRIYVQDTPFAVQLHKRFGGFTFGKDECWGFVAREGEHLPSVEEVLKVMGK